MKIWKRLLALCLCGAMALSLCACNTAANPTGGGPSDQPTGAVDPSADPDASPSIEVDLTQDNITFSAGMSPRDTLLTINGQAVPADLFLYLLAMSCSNVQMYLPYIGKTMEDLAPDLLKDTVSVAASYILLQQKAAEMGCLPTDAQVQQAHDNMMADGQESYDTLKLAFGLTDESLETLFLSNAYYENLLNIVAPTATDEMLNNYVYQARHILLLTVDMQGEPIQKEDGTYAYPPLDEATIAEKKQQAEDILAQLQAADDLDARFNELMNEYSEDSGLESNPDGYTTTTGEMVPEFEQGALTLQPGEISGIVESSYGYHIILRGEVEDIQSYADDCRQHQLDQQLNAMMDASEITRAPALDSLNVPDFFNRYLAYYSAIMDQDQSDPASSDGAG